MGRIALNKVPIVFEQGVKGLFGTLKKLVPIEAPFYGLAVQDDLRGFMGTPWGQAVCVGHIPTADNNMDVGLEPRFFHPLPDHLAVNTMWGFGFELFNGFLYVLAIAL